MTIIPVNEWILVKKIEKKKTKGGIIIPEKATKGKIQRCEVITIPFELKTMLRKEEKELAYDIGDIVLCHSQIGIKQDVEIGEEAEETKDLMFLKYDSVMGIEQK